MDWFVRSDDCPSCRAPQDDDPIVIFKKKVLRTIEPDSDDDDDSDGFGEFDDEYEDENLMYETWQIELRRNILSGDWGPRTEALQRAMTFESTMGDLTVIFGLTDDFVERMVDFQALHREPQNIIDNFWNVRLFSIDVIFRALVRSFFCESDLRSRAARGRLQKTSRGH